MNHRIRQKRPVARGGRIPPRPSPCVPRRSRGAASRGFTLVELLVVMVIISILLGFILNAAMDSVKRAQERATQALITKLEAGLNDRLDALMQTRPEANNAHSALAAVYYSSQNPPLPGYLRAQVIAWYDYIKREMPDTFFVQDDPNYPLNFAANPYPVGQGSPAALGNLAYYILPMGNTIMGLVPGGNANTGPFYGDGNILNPAGAGVYGASYPVAAGLYKNLGYLPQGYDGVDNNGNGLIDEMAEGAPSGSANQTTVQANLANHKHVTARAEMLYALLIEGHGPLGSVFNRDEFTDKEVQDTDADGLPEFVDAWGNPLQFFRWPLLYHSDLQHGQQVLANGDNNWTFIPPYLTIYDQREQNPLDQNQQLVAPMWWSGAANANSLSSSYFATSGHATSLGASGAAQAFEYYFHRLTEPVPYNNSQFVGLYWDRSTNPLYQSRRAFYPKFLVVSGGLDGQLGVFLYSDTALSGLGQNTAWALIANENNALPFSPTDPTAALDSTIKITDFTQNATYQGLTFQYSASDPLEPTNPSSYTLMQAAQDDISNQNIQTIVGIGGGG